MYTAKVPKVPCTTLLQNAPVALQVEDERDVCFDVCRFWILDGYQTRITARNAATISLPPASPYSSKSNIGLIVAKSVGKRSVYCIVYNRANLRRGPSE